MGLRFLSEAMSSFGDVFVVAPDRERSGAGHSLTLHRPLRIHSRGHRRFAVDGTPTDCVNLAIKELLKDELPALVVSGINNGANLGDDITYSGTVSAALEGALLGVPSVAISLVSTNDETPNFIPAAEVARKVVASVLKQKLPRDVVLNVNVPDVTGGRIEAFEITRMGKRHYGDAILEKIDPRGKKYYWIGGEDLGFDDAPGSDCNAILQKKVSITPIRLDYTHDLYLDILKKWEL